MGRLFGTDGARGVANCELTCELAMNIGRATAYVLTESKNNEKSTVLIGKDTRLSSDMLEGALVAGLCSVGVNVIALGVVPTPAVAYLVKKYKCDAGIMISASHNPFEFNGIKIFNSDGFKLPDALEEEIEKIVLDEPEKIPYAEAANVGTLTHEGQPIDDYIEHIKGTVNVDLNGLRVAFDCSNGSAFRSAEKLFSSLGAECFMLNDKPNGTNINDKCGSTHLEGLIKFVQKNKCNAGIAFDGDADRCLAVDETGKVVDGDFIMAICADYLKDMGKLSANTVVGTVMTNMGFSVFGKENDINFISARVGDRYVLEEMLRNNYNLGGEQSGHVIFLDHSTTGDGQLTAVQLLSILKVKNKTLSELSSIMRKYPQVIVNVKVSHEGKLKFYTDEVIKSTVQKVQDDFNRSDKKSVPDGRILVRASGTEPLIRVMVEGKSQEKIEKIANEVAEIIKNRLA